MEPTLLSGHTAVGSVAEQNLRELGHITLPFDMREAEFPGTVHVAGPVPDDIAPGCIFDVCRLGEKHESSCRCHWREARPWGHSFAVGLQKKKDTAWRSLMTGLIKPRMSPEEGNADFGEGMAYGFGADAASEQGVLGAFRGVDEIFGRVDLLKFTTRVSPKRRFTSAISSWAILTARYR